MNYGSEKDVIPVIDPGVMEILSHMQKVITVVIQIMGKNQNVLDHQQD